MLSSCPQLNSPSEGYFHWKAVTLSYFKMTTVLQRHSSSSGKETSILITCPQSTLLLSVYLKMKSNVPMILIPKGDADEEWKILKILQF